MTQPESTRPSSAAENPGTVLTLGVAGAAAGGTFIARHEGRVVFVRGASPGETVSARLLDDPVEARDARFWRADTVDVLEPGVDRVPSVWPEAGADGVGGAEWAHIALPAQRRIGTEVLRELLHRARVTSFPLDEVQVEPAPHDFDGLGWRTRVRFAVAPDGTVGMRGWRSHDVRPVGANPLAAEPIRALDLGAWTAPEGVEAIDAVAPSAGPVAVVLIGRDLDPSRIEIPPEWDGADVAVRTARGLAPLRGDGLVRERVGERLFDVSASGFWQVHRRAAELLSEVVDATLDAPRGGSAWDLYGGVGLFAAVAAQQVGSEGTVRTVEGNRRASELAATNLADLPQVSTSCADVEDWVRARRGGVDCVVLDPPRTGAGISLIERLTSIVRHRIVYVSCEPSALARDVAAAEKNGWRIRELRAFDLFPHTHHIETVAVLERAA